MHPLLLHYILLHAWILPLYPPPPPSRLTKIPALIFSASCSLPFALLLFSHNTTLSNLPPSHSRRCWELVQPRGIRRNLNIWVCPSLSWKPGSASTCSCVNSLRLNMQAMQPSARVPTSSLWEEILIMVIMTEEIPLRGTLACYCVTSEHGKYDRGLRLLPQKKKKHASTQSMCARKYTKCLPALFDAGTVVTLGPLITQ